MATFVDKSTWLAKQLDADPAKNAAGDTVYVYFDRDLTRRWHVYDQQAVTLAWELKHSDDEYERLRWYSFWCAGAGWEARHDELERYGLRPNGA